MKNILYLFILLCLIFILWDHKILFPLKLLVVFFHESSHALATIITGGGVEKMVIVPEQGGYVLTYGGNRFISLSSGYLGSLFWGVLIYMLAIFTRFDKAVMIILGIFVGILTLLLSSTIFTIAFGLIATVIMILLGILFNQYINDFILRVIGLTSMIYVPIDIFSDTIYNSHLKSDAYMLAEEFGGTAVMWGGIWLLISIFTIFWCIRWSLLRKDTISKHELKN